MKKPESLKALLLASVPGLKDKPENLSMFIDKGRIAARNTGSLSFEYRYTVNVVVQDYAGDVDALFVPLLSWVAERQPDLLERDQQEPFSFESEILDGDLADVSVDLELTERVKVARTDGGLVVTHLDEPSREDEFANADGARFWAAIIDDVTGGTIFLAPDA
ncbi:phage tail protein [Sphingomonas hylomeconis]|uniref:Phage tail protein n=1 Tax=Sphingomonas hylomeconis TaxID=1395958 RepID=A0ABV7STQ0_9SPHN|nr:phage tail protein [Sphingomonas hylomeconis]